MRSLLLAVLLVGCADPVGMGEASSNAYADAASATVTVANVGIETGVYRVWSIEIGAAPPGTDCMVRGDALIVFEVYTTLSSAPRGNILLEHEPPPLVFPAVYAYYPDGVPIDGVMSIDFASSTRVLGSFRGDANIGGTVLTLEATFDAPTCGV